MGFDRSLHCHTSYVIPNAIAEASPLSPEQHARNFSNPIFAAVTFAALTARVIVPLVVRPALQVRLAEDQ